jgi:hypothetical protein
VPARLATGLARPGARREVGRGLHEPEAAKLADAVGDGPLQVGDRAEYLGQNSGDLRCG